MKRKQFLLTNIFSLGTETWVLVMKFVDSPKAEKNVPSLQLTEHRFCVLSFVNIHFSSSRVIVEVAHRKVHQTSLKIPKINFLSLSCSLLYRRRNRILLFPFSVRLSIRKHAPRHQILIKKSFLDDFLASSMRMNDEDAFFINHKFPEVHHFLPKGIRLPIC